MGDTTAQPDFTGAFASGAEAFVALDEAVWSPISRATLLRSRPQLGERVLDACAGAGASALPTAELVGADGHVDAVDLSEPLIAHIREQAGERMPQLHAHVADVLEWPESGYDLVHCVLGVQFFDDLDASARYLVSRAAVGGRVVITVWGRDAWNPVIDALRKALPGADEPAQATARDDDPMSSLHRPGDVARWMHELGLTQVRAELVDRHVPLDDDLAWNLATGTGLRVMLDDLDDEAVGGVRERMLAAVADVTTLPMPVIVGTGVRNAADA